RTLAESMGVLFTGVVDAPWCYLEFGNVDWCERPGALDRRLRAAADAIATEAQAGACQNIATTRSSCELLAGSQPGTLRKGAQLLRAARANGDLFLALPANQAARNSINDAGSLLRALCGGATDATACRGPTAREAEFRTQGGTDARLAGLLLIAGGALGMLL